MHPTVKDRLWMREYARRCGDTSLERACDADLARYGYQDGAMETTVVDAAPERAVPPEPRRRGRPPRPRCEHDQIVGRCEECGFDDLREGS